MENWDASIAIWTNLVDENPLDERLLEKLITAYKTKRGLDERLLEKLITAYKTKRGRMYDIQNMEGAGEKAPRQPSSGPTYNSIHSEPGI
jgi:DNA-binding SARP family transcriptional activator